MKLGSSARARPEMQLAFHSNHMPAERDALASLAPHFLFRGPLIARNIANAKSANNVVVKS